MFRINTKGLLDLKFEKDHKLYISDRVSHNVVFLNPHSYIGLKSKAVLQRLIDKKTKFYIDGIGLQLMLALFGHKKRRCTGFQFLKKNFNFYKKNLFIGGNIDVNYHGLLQAGCERFDLNSNSIYVHSPPFDEKFDYKTIAEINIKIQELDPDAIWICVGAPKQEDLMLKISPSPHTKVIACVGAVIDDLAFPRQHPPKFISTIGFEWLYRLVANFRRTWKRILISLPMFIIVILFEYGVKKLK